MAFTVKATQSGGAGIFLAVKVLSGARVASSPATATENSLTLAPTASITTTTVGAQVYGSIIYTVNNSSTFTAAAGNTIADSIAGVGDTFGSTRLTAAVVTPGATAVGATAPAGNGTFGTSAAFLEILPAGTIAQDGSTPAAVASGALSSITTAAFTPPPGTLLVALVNTDAAQTIPVITDTSGLGLVWTRQVSSTSASQSGGAWIYTAVMPGVAFDNAVGASTAGTAFTVSPHTWTHVNNGNCIIVAFDASAASTNLVSAVTYGGVNIPLLTSQNGAGATPNLTVYGLAGPTVPTGSNTVSVTFTTGSGDFIAGSVSLSGAASLGTPVSNSIAGAGAGTLTVSVPGTTAGGVIVASATFGGGGGGTFSGTNGVTIGWQNNVGTGNAGDNATMGTVSSAGGAQTVGFSDSGGSDTWTLIAVEVLPPSPPSSPPPPRAQPGSAWRVQRKFSHTRRPKPSVVKIPPPFVTNVTGALTSNVGPGGVLLRVYALTGQAASPIGNTGSAAFHAASTVLAASITTTQTGSRVYGALENNNTSGASSAQAGTTLVDDVPDGLNSAQYLSCKTTSLTGTPGAATVGATNAFTSGSVALVEILPGTGLTEDLSSPPPVSSTSLTSVTSAWFAPPPGSLLVALFTAEGDGVNTQTASITDAAGLVWTQQKLACITASGLSGVWTAQVPPAPVAPTNVNVNAPGVAATGVSPQPVVKIDLPQTGVAATGSAPQATVSLTVFAGIPTATGTAPGPVPAISVLAGIPTATGTSPAPSIQTGLTVNAGIPTATGAAPGPVVAEAVKPGIPTATGSAAAIVAEAVLAGIPTATGSAPAPQILTGLTVNAGIPTATGAASQPVVADAVIPGIPTATGSAAGFVNIQAKPGIPTATGTAPQPTVAEAILAGIPVATGVAPQPGIVTGLVITAPPVTAAGSASAIANIQPIAGAPVATGTPAQPVAAPSAFAGAPTATGSAAAVANIRPVAGAPTATGAAAATVSIFVNAAIPVATGTSPQPGIVTGLVINAPPVTASGLVSQPVIAEVIFAGIPAATGSAPPVTRGVGAGIPTATGFAPQAKIAESVFALVAVAAGVAPDAQAVSVLPHVTARSTSSVDAKVNSTSAADDPREASSAVGGRGSTSSADSSKGGAGSPLVTGARDSVSSVT
jgi:hypothetical protein